MAIENYEESVRRYDWIILSFKEGKKRERTLNGACGFCDEFYDDDADRGYECIDCPLFPDICDNDPEDEEANKPLYLKMCNAETDLDFPLALKLAEQLLEELKKHKDKF